MAKETKTNPVEQTATVAGKAVTEKLSTQFTGVHATFSLLLDEIKTNNKISNGLTLGQLRYEKDIDKEAVKGEEQLNKVIKGLKDVNDTLKSIKKSSTGTPIGGKESAISAGLPKAATNLTLTEKLKSVVGGVKSAGNKFMKAGGDVVGAVTDTLTDPGAAIKKAYGGSKGVIKGTLGAAKDILSTKSDYSVEQERFATAFSKTSRGGLMQGKKTGKEVGAEAFNKLKAKQEEVEKQKAVLKPFEEQGFAPVGEKKKLAKLQKELADMDPRVQKEEKNQKAKQVVEKKQEAEVKSEKSTQKKANVEGKVSSKAEKDPSKVPAFSASEDLLKEIQANNVTLGSLLSVTQTQLVSINAIKEALAPTTPKEIAEQKSAPSAEAVAPTEGKTLGDAASEALSIIPGGGKGAPGKKGIGGKILGGLGKAAKFLGPAAAIAGAAYSGFEGYQNTEQNFDIEEGKQATTGQKVASTLGGVASGLTFGLLDEKSAAQGIHKAGSAIGDFFNGKKNAPVSPATAAAPGATVAQTSTENVDMAREASAKGGGGNNTVVSNNVTNEGTTKFVPMKATPRPEYTGSSLDRYTSRITVY
jgi:hypothetical protein